MNKVISEKIKTSIIEQVVFGDNVRDVAEKYHVSRASIYRWMKAYEYRQKYNTDNLLTFTQMKRIMDRATKKLHILSSAPCGTNSPLLPRYKYIETIFFWYIYHFAIRSCIFCICNIWIIYWRTCKIRWILWKRIYRPYHYNKPYISPTGNSG